ncbi:hypothetical protein [Vulgatibacter incomptus]|uniref:Cytochrome P460 domain-containing protein n=1 Tax=Vulgatibacter incomptus TaxID=1391653 RepID=A0A0K1PH83_9BACT|nr:hypothetical protein [Vulgatibacter incomptus]AKU92880.1 hypothetical protein AKJ08_3267 [Vulgatibacter incomptus]
MTVPGGNTTAPSPEAQQILDQIQGYRTWPTFRTVPEPTFSQAHGGRYLITYYNGVVEAAIEQDILPLPNGAIFVAENRTSPDLGEPPVLTIMSKAQGRWYWLQLADSQVLQDSRGRPIEGYGGGGTTACLECHSQNRRNDFVFGHNFSRPY